MKYDSAKGKEVHLGVEDTFLFNVFHCCHEIREGQLS